MARTVLGLVHAAPLILAACGDSNGEHALSGAVIGAGGGILYCQAVDANC